MSIRVDGLHFQYGANHILNGINLEVQQGKLVGLIGPNGSGKSTCLKCLYRVLKPSHGAIFIEDQALTQMPIKASAQKMAVVSQHNQTQFDFSVEEMLLLGRSPYKRALERDNERDYALVDKALEAVSMTAFRTRSYSSLSGGEQQRIMLARALVQEPSYLVLDEPTNHMDVQHQLALLKLVKDTGITTIAALHDLNLAMQYCDWIVVLKNGEVYTSGQPQVVLTEALIQAVYGVKAKCIQVEGSQRPYIVFEKI